MRLDRCLAEQEAGGDLGVRAAASELEQHFSLAFGELAERDGFGRARKRRRDEALDQAARDRGREERLACRDGTDGVDQGRPRYVLEQEAGRARTEQIGRA